jgi:hypothetical protein
MANLPRIEQAANAYRQEIPLIIVNTEKIEQEQGTIDPKRSQVPVLIPDRVAFENAIFREHIYH